MDLALNKIKKLICHKTESTNQPEYKNIVSDVFFYNIEEEFTNL